MTDLALRYLSELAILATAGVFALLIRSWLAEVRAISASVAKVAELVRRHGESLADGNRRFKDLDRELARLAKVLDGIQRDGCAFRKACKGATS